MKPWTLHHGILDTPCEGFFDDFFEVVKQDKHDELT